MIPRGSTVARAIFPELESPPYSELSPPSALTEYEFMLKPAILLPEKISLRFDST